MANICQLDYASSSVTDVSNFPTNTPLPLNLDKESPGANIIITGGNTITISNPGIYLIEFNGTVDNIPESIGNMYIEMVNNPTGTILRRQIVQTPSGQIVTSFSKILSVTSPPQNIFFQAGSTGEGLLRIKDLFITIIQIG